MAFARVVIAVAVLAGCSSGPSPAPDEVSIPGTPVKLGLVYVPGGRLGDVALKPFWIGTHEVTWEAYSLYYENQRQAKVDGVSRPTQPDVVNPKAPINGAEQTEKHPALGLGWYGAAGFCEWLSYWTGQPFRLPTEAEWEFASLSDSAVSDEAAWHKGNSGAHSHAVGSRKPNARGLYDTLGNVWEHCLEPFAPPGWVGVVRGGAWNGSASHATRQKVLMEEWLDRDPKFPHRAWWLTDAQFVGFRVVRLADDGASKEERAAAVAKLEIKNLKIVDLGEEPYYLARVTGEIIYSGSRPLDEVEVTVFYLDEKGKPRMIDVREKPCFNTCHPVLVNAYHDGGRRKPMAAGETRKFELEVPRATDDVGPLGKDKVGAKVSRVRFCRP